MKHLISLLLLLNSFQNVAQSDTIDRFFGMTERRISVLTGYNGWGNHYAELGVALNKDRYLMPAMFSSVVFASAEIRPARATIVGTKVGAWMSGGCGAMAMGINAIWYTNGKENTLRLRPEIGFGIGPFKVVYGYNIPLSNRDFDGVNTHNIGAAFLIGVKRLKNPVSATH